MKPEEYAERTLALEGWPIHVTSYRLGTVYLCKVDNVSPGALIARAEGPTQAGAEEAALSKARERLARTQRHAV